MNCVKPSRQTLRPGLAILRLLAPALAIGLFANATPVSAQITYGKLTGVVTDAQTGEPLSTAQIVIEGTGLGSLSAENGRYFVINVPPGTYTVEVQLMGYQTFRVENVLIPINATRVVDFELTPQAIAVEEVRVEIEQTPLIEISARGSRDLISSGELEALPVRTVEEALELRQGFFVVPDNENILAFTEKTRAITPIRIRGGRNGETVTLIDGIPINNFIFGGPAFSLTKAAIGQIDFRKGGFPPEYGNALSGIINIATKEPGTELSGGIEFQTSGVAGALGSRPDELNDFSFLEGDIGGAVPGTSDKLRFLVAGRRRSSAARVLEFDDDVYDPSVPATDALNQPHNRDVFPGWRAFGYDDEQQLFAKLSYQFTPTSKLSVSLIDVTRQYQRFDFDFSLTGYDAQGSPIIDTVQDSLAVANSNYEDVVLGSVQMDRTLFVAKYSQVIERTFFNVNFGVFHQKRLNCNFFEGVCLGASFSDKNFSSQFVAPGVTVAHPARGTDDLYGGEDITTYVVRADIGSQVSDHHNVQLGVFANRHDLDFDEDIQIGVNELFAIKQKYSAEPWDAAFYVQDVIEYDFLSLDLGLRFDIGKAGGLFFVDPLDPTNGTTAREVCEDPARFGADPNYFTGLLACADPAVRDSGAIIAAEDDFEETSTRVQVSPRLGVTFPVTATTNVFFNYAINSQNPQLNNVFQNTAIGTVGEARPCGLPGVARDAVQKGECGPIIYSHQFATSYLGNPNLEIERASNYEIGVLSELGDNWALSFILFNKDQFGLTGVRRGGIGVQDIGATHGTSSPNYDVLVNEDFQTVRGLEVGVRRRLANFWALDVNYSFSQARTNAAPPERERQSVADEGDPTIRREIRSEIDQPHRLNAMLRFAAGAETPEIRVGGVNVGDALKYASVAMSLQASSGMPYTPTLSFSGTNNVLDQGERNSGRGPSTFWVDLRASKGFRVGNLRYNAFVQIDNLFDRKNCFQPLSTTGRCDYGSRDQSRRRQGNVVGEAAPSTYFDRPHLFGPRRQINVGVRVDF